MVLTAATVVTGSLDLGSGCFDFQNRMRSALPFHLLGQMDLTATAATVADHSRINCFDYTDHPSDLFQINYNFTVVDSHYFATVAVLHTPDSSCIHTGCSTAASSCCCYQMGYQYRSCLMPDSSMSGIDFVTDIPYCYCAEPFDLIAFPDFRTFGWCLAAAFGSGTQGLAGTLASLTQLVALATQLAAELVAELVERMDHCFDY